MKKIYIFLIILGLIFSLLNFSTAKVEPKSRKIVIFKEGVNDRVKDLVLRSLNVEEVKDLKLIGAKVVFIKESKVKELLKRPEILRIDPDAKVYTLESEPFSLFTLFKLFKGKPFQSPQILTWNIDRVDAEISWKISTGDPIKVGVIDTGIQLDHPDLQANIKGGYSAVWYTLSPNDDNGHGTHVAGIIAGLDNNIGVIGIGPNIDLYAIKVLDRRGTGYLSDVIDGIEWAIQNKMQVINMSLGTNQNVQSFHEAIRQAYSAGITIVAAAGNTGGSVVYPAAYPEVIAVSATDQNDQITYWSSRGSEIDLAAPGSNIYSTYKGSKYETLSGTSMAAPHVSGAAALVINTKKCDLDLDEICSPLEVKQRLEKTAIDLGDPGKDDLYGSGLINVYQALTF